jgi:hypothetical protein
LFFYGFSITDDPDSAYGGFCSACAWLPLEIYKKIRAEEQ